MMAPSTRIAGGMACRAQVQCALRSAPARARHMTTATARPTTTTTRLGTVMGGRTHTQLAQYRPFSVSASRATAENKEDITKDIAKDTAAEAVETQTQTAEAAEAAKAAETAETAQITESAAAEDSPAPKDELPWYLRVKVPKHETLTPQTTPLPDIPANAPPLLEPLVTFAADDLGLDDLKILDLRGLDPPAGLGPDLIMLFSTSRSERHLHVSADRLVRWFRTYGVNASADGLLGRNELKIKLKRKARRAKLLGNMSQLAVGGAEEVDDGISTKWVCVNAGFIGGRANAKDAKDAKDAKNKKEPLHAETSVVDARGRTSGFGSARSAGTTVVVQIFTEGKRKQMELEQLWTKTLWHSLRKRRAAGEDVKEQLRALESEMKMGEDELDKADEDWLAGLPSADESTSGSAASTSTTTASSPSGASF